MDNQPSVPPKDEKPKDKGGETWWERVYANKPEEEKKRLRSFIPLFLYTFLFIYTVIYLSILNTVNRNQKGTTVRAWWGDDLTYAEKEAKKLHDEIDTSYKLLRKQVSGGH